MTADGDQKAANAAAPGPPRHVLLTGGSSGIGLQAAMRLLAAGHRLTVPCRDAASAARLGQVLAALAEQPPEDQPLGGRLATPICDLADLASVERCAADLLAAGSRSTAWCSTPACSTAAPANRAGRCRVLSSRSP